MKKKTKSEGPIYIPVESLDDAARVLTEARRTGKISFSPYDNRIPDSIYKGCKTLHDRVKAISKYLINRGDADITDDEFFKLLKNDPGVLQHRYAIEKIRRWQEEALTDRTKKAQDKLRRIGEVLAGTRGRKPRTHETEIVGRRWEVRNKLKGAAISKIRSEGERCRLLNEMFGVAVTAKIKKESKKPLDRCTTEALADLVTASLCKCAVSTVETYRKKKVQRINTKFSIPIFRVKKVD